jgi:hypothetical protein
VTPLSQQLLVEALQRSGQADAAEQCITTLTAAADASSARGEAQLASKSVRSSDSCSSSSNSSSSRSTNNSNNSSSSSTERSSNSSSNSSSVTPTAEKVHTHGSTALSSTQRRAAIFELCNAGRAAEAAVLLQQWQQAAVAAAAANSTTDSNCTSSSNENDSSSSDASATAVAAAAAVQHPPASVYTVVLEALMKSTTAAGATAGGGANSSRSLRQVLQLVNAAVAAGVALNRVSYTCAIVACGKLQQHRQAIDLLEHALLTVSLCQCFNH